jgi:hypothetical protein
MTYATSPQLRQTYFLNFQRTMLDEIKDVGKYLQMKGELPRIGKPGFASLGDVPEQKSIFDNLKKIQEEAKAGFVAEILNKDPST